MTSRFAESSGRAVPHRTVIQQDVQSRMSRLFDAVRRVSIRCCGRDEALIAGARDVVFERE